MCDILINEKMTMTDFKIRKYTIKNIYTIDFPLSAVSLSFWLFGRVVKAVDLKSTDKLSRRFESCSSRDFFFATFMMSVRLSLSLSFIV
jgi:hypothetical protein